VIAGLSPSRAALLVIDIQERLAPVMPSEVLPQLVRNAQILIEAAKRMALPIVVSQQYPKGLGATIAPIEEALAGAPVLHRFDKLEFSAAATPEFGALYPRLARDQWIVCGVETHVCVYQTVRGLVDRGAAVHVCADAVASRSAANFRTGMALIERAGGVPTSTEATVFELLARAGSDDFKLLSRLIK